MTAMNGKTVFKIITDKTSKSGDFIFFNFECEADTVSDFVKIIKDDGIIVGHVFDIMSGSHPGEKIISRRREMAFGLSTVKQVEVAVVDFVEGDASKAMAA